MVIHVDGSSLTLRDVRQVVKGERVELEPEAQQRITSKHETMIEYANKGNPVYGLNRGVGAKRNDWVAGDDSGENYTGQSAAALNRELIYTSCVSFGNPCTPEETRAILTVKLNTLAKGVSGVRLPVARKIAWMLNHEVLPQLPSRGSIGDADFTILAHLGLGLLGEGDFWVGQEITSASQMRKRTEFQSVRLLAKDALAVMSSNDFSNGRAAVRLVELRQLAKLSELTGALSLEALDGNSEPLLEETNDLTEKRGQSESAERMREYLAGSFVLKEEVDSLQDPLSFRCMTQVFGAFRGCLEDVSRKLEEQFNSSEDNPAVVNDEVLPTGNFQNLHWVLPFRALLDCLTHLARISARRVDHVLDPHYRDLEYGAPVEDRTFGFNSLPYAVNYLEEKIRSSANLQPPAFLPAARGIEDHAPGGPQVLERAEDCCEYLRKLIALEGLASTHVLVESDDDPDSLGTGTVKLYRTIEEELNQLQFLRNASSPSEVLGEESIGKLVERVEGLVDSL